MPVPRALAAASLAAKRAAKLSAAFFFLWQKAISRGVKTRAGSARRSGDALLDAPDLHQVRAYADDHRVPLRDPGSVSEPGTGFLHPSLHGVTRRWAGVPVRGGGWYPLSKLLFCVR